MASKKKTETNGRTIVGFRKVETSLSGFWKPEAGGECLQGIVGPAIETTGRDGSSNRFFTIALTSPDGGPIVTADERGNEKSVAPEVGMIVGVGGKMLFQFLAAREGQEVYLVYKGLGKKKPGQSAPKMYDTYERE